MRRSRASRTRRRGIQLNMTILSNIARQKPDGYGVWLGGVETFNALPA
jgi:hypothetical protein